MNQIQDSVSLAARPHPLHSITSTEIAKAAALLKSILSKRDAVEGITSKLRFKNISIQEPPKALLLPYLDAEAAGVPIDQRPFVPRCVAVVWSSNNERNVVESVVSLDAGCEVDQTRATYGQHSSIDRYGSLLVCSSKSPTNMLLATNPSSLRNGFLMIQKSWLRSRSSIFHQMWSFRVIRGCTAQIAIRHLIPTS